MIQEMIGVEEEGREEKTSGRQALREGDGGDR